MINNTAPCPNLCYVYASLKTPPKNPVGKKGRRKGYITCITYVAPVASLKPCIRKPSGKNSSREKEYNS